MRRLIKRFVKDTLSRRGGDGDGGEEGEGVMKNRLASVDLC